MKEYAARFCRDESGQDLVEYALLLSVLAVASVATLSVLATSISTLFSNTSTTISGS